MLAAGFARKAIAQAIGRCKSVLSREIKRNRDQRSGVYKAVLAEKKHNKRLSDKPKKKFFTEPMQQLVRQQLTQKLSPEQITGICKKQGIACVSAERIYQYIWQDKKAKRDLYRHLRNRGKRYRKRGSRKDSRGILCGRVSIEQRPAIVELKERFGDMEIDTMVGKNSKGAIVTINDRTTGLLRMKKSQFQPGAARQRGNIRLVKRLEALLAYDYGR